MDYALVTLFGLLWGSFCNVMIYRIPREIPLGLWKNMRSACIHCQSKVRWYHNVPLLSYVMLRGKCADCEKPISWRYPLVEALCALTFLLVYKAHQGHASALYGTASWVYWADLVKNLYFFLSLIAVIFIDIDFRIIPDRFSLGNWVIALGAAFALGTPHWIDSLIGGLMGFGLFFLLAWGYEKLRKIEGLGMGDVKMMGWLGAWLGFESVPLIVLMASVTGIIIGMIAMRRSKDGWQTALPFGPFLALSAAVVWFLAQMTDVPTL
ncbi:MAG TPA: A24 family peptidase [Bdellovibrionota bacterium]|jgi:leader peptidase (prepilin peptidase)/N-methyltransferase|nr:A24 family peptidase [Bdellovibrionota bacterium]